MKKESRTGRKPKLLVLTRYEVNQVYGALMLAESRRVNIATEAMAAIRAGQGRGNRLKSILFHDLGFDIHGFHRNDEAARRHDGADVIELGEEE